MSSGKRSCRGTKDDGDPCRSPIVGEDGFCPAHRPGGREELRRRARKGAEATRRVWQGEGLDPEELPPLTSPQAAERWLERIGRAVATGELSNRDADAATRTVRAWLQAHNAGAVAERIAELQGQVEELKGRESGGRGRGKLRSL